MLGLTCGSTLHLPPALLAGGCTCSHVVPIIPRAVQELTLDMLHLLVYCAFFAVVFSTYGIPLHLVRVRSCSVGQRRDFVIVDASPGCVAQLACAQRLAMPVFLPVHRPSRVHSVHLTYCPQVRDLYWTFRNFNQRVRDFLRYRRITGVCCAAAFAMVLAPMGWVVVPGKPVWGSLLPSVSSMPRSCRTPKVLSQLPASLWCVICPQPTWTRASQMPRRRTCSGPTTCASSAARS